MGGTVAGAGLGSGGSKYAGNKIGRRESGDGNWEMVLFCECQISFL